MVDETIKAKIELSSNTDVETQKASKLNKQLEQVVETAKKVGGSTAAANAAARATPASKGATGTYQEENKDYGTARGMVGTGAAGRDFSKQAQGLGGLVHVYATFAANIFAVSAAFMALDKAYSLLRLDKAADIMSNKIGFSVKNLSKDLVEATGHAISFQEAMQFSNMGISAGLTGKQITDLTIMAKGAANALGRDMGDAVRRMIQGTAKQEQEILDELGIFVKAKTAYAEYAKKIGVGADELTATQRVQAYANAVSKAGEKWKEFAGIEDPFSKFLSTGKESLVELLNLVNSFVAPILNLLSKSKALIEGIILVTVTKLGTMALPHLGDQLKNMFTVDKAVIDKQIEGYNLLVTEKQAAISKLYAVKETTGISIRQAYQHMNMVGTGVDLSKGIIPGALDNRKVLPTDKVEISDRINKSILNSIKTSTELEEAKTQKLITQKSTLDNIIVNKTTLNSLAAQAVKIGIAENENLADYHRLQGLILDEKAALISLEEGQLVKLNSTKFANTKIQSEAASKAYGIAGATDIGWMSKGGDPGKISQIWTTLTTSIKQSTGAMGTFGAVFSAVTTGMAIGLQKVMVAMPYLMLAFAAWELVIKPIWDHFHAAEQKIAESSKALEENSMALKASFMAFNDFIQKPTTTGEELLVAIERKAQALTTLRDSLSKLLVDLQATEKEKTAKEAGVSMNEVKGYKSYNTAGGSTLYKKVSVEASEPLKAINNMLNSASAADKTTDAYAKLVIARTEMYNIEAKNTEKTKEELQYNKEWQSSLEKTIGVTEAYSLAQQKLASQISSVITPSSQASKSIKEYMDKSHEATTQDLKDIGIKDPTMQEAYRGQAKALQHLVDITSSQERNKSAGTVLEKIIEDLHTMKIAAPETVAAFQELFISLAGQEEGARKNTIANIMRLYGSVQSAAVIANPMGSGDAQAILAKNYALDQELAISKIESAKRLLSLSNEQMTLEEKYLGYKTSASIQLTKTNELEVIKLEHERTLAAILKKEKEDADLVGEKAHKVANEAKKKNTEAQKDQERLVELKTKQLEIDRQLAIYDIQIGSQQKLYAEQLDSLQKTSDIYGLLNEEDKIRLERTNTIRTLENEITRNKYEQSLLKPDNINGIAKLSYATELAQQKIISANKLMDAKLDKKERDDSIKDNVTKLKLYDLQLAKLHEASEWNFKAIEAAHVRQKIADAEKLKTEGEIAAILREEHEGEMRDIKLQTLFMEKRKKAEEDYKAQLLDRQKSFSQLDTQGKWQTGIDIIAMEAKNFEKTLTPVITSVFKAIYSGMDAAIDTLTTKWMKGEKFVVRDVVIAFRNTMAEQMRSAAAEQMKMAGRQTMQAGSVAIASLFGKTIDPNSFKTNDQIIQNNWEKLLQQEKDSYDVQEKSRLAQENLLEYMKNGPTTSNSPTGGLAGMDQNQAIMSKDSQGSSTAGNVAGQIGGMLGNYIGGNGIAGNIAGKVIGSASSSLMESIISGIKFADGGIMTNYGAMQLNTYASGGIANRPQLAMFGEGRTPEAYVPLPDGKSIPVTMKAPVTSNSSQNGPVSVQVNVHTTTGQSSTQATGGGNTNAMAEFGNIIAQKVREEIIQQSRPNGLLNR